MLGCRESIGLLERKVNAPRVPFVILTKYFEFFYVRARVPFCVESFPLLQQGRRSFFPYRFRTRRFLLLLIYLVVVSEMVVFSAL